MKRITWVRGARYWYRMWSVWAMVLLGLYPYLVENQSMLGEYIPEKHRPLFGLLLCVLGVFTRLVQQQRLTDTVNSEEQS